MEACEGNARACQASARSPVDAPAAANLACDWPCLHRPHRHMGRDPVDSFLGRSTHAWHRALREGFRLGAHFRRRDGRLFRQCAACGCWGRKITYFFLCAASLIACTILFRTFDTYNGPMMAMLFVVGALTAAFFGWLPLYLPELFPTRSRATGQGIGYNAGRIFAAIGTLWGGGLVHHYGGSYAKSASVITLVYALGMVLIFLRRRPKAGHCRNNPRAAAPSHRTRTQTTYGDEGGRCLKSPYLPMKGKIGNLPVKKVRGCIPCRRDLGFTLLCNAAISDFDVPTYRLCASRNRAVGLLGPCASDGL